MKKIVRISVDQEPTRHPDGDFFSMSISGDGIETSVPIDATAGGRFIAMRRAEEVLIRNGIVPEHFDLDVKEDERRLFPFFEFNQIEPSQEMMP